MVRMYIVSSLGQVSTRVPNQGDERPGRDVDKDPRGQHGHELAVELVSFSQGTYLPTYLPTCVGLGPAALDYEIAAKRALMMGGVPIEEHEARPGMPMYAYFGIQKPSRWLEPLMGWGTPPSRGLRNPSESTPWAANRGGLESPRTFASCTAVWCG